jgi:hypothetical protein
VRAILRAIRLTTPSCLSDSGQPLVSRYCGRICILLVLLGFNGFASADWTGVAFEIGSLEADWKFSDGTRKAKSNSLLLQVEERAGNGFTVGVGFGYHSLRLDSDNGSDSIDFEVQNFEIYLRQEFPLSESVTVEGLLNYGLYAGDENSSDDRAEIDWNQVSVEIAVVFRLERWRITPFASYTNIDGDTSDLDGAGSFELEDPFNQGLRFDIFTDSTAFVRIELQAGSQAGGYLSFVRRY